MPRSTYRLTATLAATGLALTLAACGDDSTDDDQTLDERQEEVAERGADVMPFDLDATLHRFAPQDDGLVQTVTAEDPDDSEQVTLIRRHLEEEAGAFTDGDFADPASIHGEDMPGLAELEAGADNIDVTYSELDDGARLTYTTDDPDLVTALHAWGDAQVMDHGDHAEHVQAD